MTDLEYTTYNGVVKFYPKTECGKKAWLEIGDTIIFKHHLASVLHQLKAAGYSVRAARKTKNKISDDELLSALCA